MCTLPPTIWEKLLGAIDKILAVDPNNDKVLPIKARIFERQGKNIEALDIYKRLYALYPNNFELMTEWPVPTSIVRRKS